VDNWFQSISAAVSLTPLTARKLQSDGFVVVPGPLPEFGLAKLVLAYDQAILDADPEDVGIGRTTMRVNDFVNRGAVFDELYLQAQILEGCCRVIQQPFRLSSILGRTLNPHSPAQKLHVDFPGDQKGWPMLGFIFMVDEFRPENGATGFAPGSQGTTEMPDPDCVVQACGPAGSVIIYNGSVWHGHGANLTDRPRRSIQGAYIRRSEQPALDWAARMRSDTASRLGPLARYLLAPKEVPIPNRKTEPIVTFQ
jgi:hypothetical protein